MISFAISILFYFMTEALLKKYKSTIFEKVKKLSMYSALASFLAIGLFFTDVSVTMEWIAISMLFIASLLTYGLTWKQWMIYALGAIGVISLILNMILGLFASGVLLILANIVIFVYLSKNKKIEMNMNVAMIIMIVSWVIDIVFPNSIWRCWEGIAVLYIMVNRLITYLNAVYFQSITDKLTGLYNKEHFINYTSEFIHSIRDKKTGVLFLYVENVENSNQSQKDIVIADIALILKEHVADKGICGRLGTEELAACIIDNNIVQLAESIQLAIFDKLQVTVLIGVSYALNKNIEAEELINQADDAMYQAKSNNKQKIVLYNHQ